MPELPYYDYDLPEKYKPEHEQDQLYHPIQKPGTEPGQHWQRPCPVDLAILRDGLRWQVKAIDFYFKAAEELGEHYGNFFRTKGNEETRCFKMILNLLCDLNDNGYGKIPKQYLGGFLDWESSLPSGADYIVDGLSGSKGSGPKQKQPAARQRPYGGFFCPPGRYPRPRMINKSKARACLTGAIVMVAEATTIYEEQIKCLGHPVVRNLLIRIWMHEKEVLVELTEKLLEILPDDY